MHFGVGIYGMNGHQIQRSLISNSRAKLVAAAAVDEKWLKAEVGSVEGIRIYQSLEQMLRDEQVKLVSLCSPKRREQAHDAVLCMRAGKHVYAEKPCAMTEEDLDNIIKTARDTGMVFHEMASTAFEEPYATLTEIVKTGKLGTIVQVFAQKSYPYFKERPQNEDIDGGLIMQNAIHAVRMVEHVAGHTVIEVKAYETSLGNPQPEGELKMAASLMMKLDNGGVAAIIANYLNQKEFGSWGNEQLRIFGTQGFVKSVNTGLSCKLVVQGEKPCEVLAVGGRKNYFEMILDEVLDRKQMPISIEEELHPTRIVIKAKASAKI